MSVVLYTETNFNGDSITLDPGDYTRNFLRDIYHGNFEGQTSSLRISRNTIVLLSNSSSPTGNGDNRVLIGPLDISDLSSIGFDNSTNSIKIRRYRDDNWGATGSASIFSNYNFSGNFKNLRTGEYSAARIAAKEDNRSGISDGEIRSLTIGKNTIVILYDGPNFENSMKAVYIEGPTNVPDLAPYNMDGDLSSIKVFSVDTPPSIPNNTIVGPPSPYANPNDSYRGLGSYNILPSSLYTQLPNQQHITPPSSSVNTKTENTPLIAKVYDMPDSSIMLLLFIIILVTALLIGSVIAYHKYHLSNRPSENLWESV